MYKHTPLPAKNPYEQNRKTVRWAYHDYATSGIYYITIVTKDRYYYFGDIVDEKMIFTEQGKIAEECLLDIPNHYSMVNILNHVVMPNHIHILFQIDNEEADQEDYERLCKTGGVNMREIRRKTHGKNTVSDIMGAFKAAVTRQCNRRHLEFDWLGRFYDHVVRNEEERLAYDRYIRNNIMNWDIEKNGDLDEHL